MPAEFDRFPYRLVLGTGYTSERLRIVANRFDTYLLVRTFIRSDNSLIETSRFLATRRTGSRAQGRFYLNDFLIASFTKGNGCGCQTPESTMPIPEVTQSDLDLLLTPTPSPTPS